jgi:AcrR family transcriptional regulator
VAVVEAQRRRRSDGQRNRVRLLDTAGRLFVERGPDVPFLEIAREAGVGVGTIYRHFPTREELIEAVYRSELDAVCDAAGELLATLLPQEALRCWMTRFVEYMTTKIGLHDAIAAVVAKGGDPFARSHDRQRVAIGSLMAATADAGVTRPEVKPDDVLLALAGIAIAAGAAEDPGQTTRMIDLLYTGTLARSSTAASSMPSTARSGSGTGRRASRGPDQTQRRTQ